MLAPQSNKSLFSKAWHMLGSPSLVVISIPTLANFVFLYALPIHTKILPTFPMQPLHEASRQSRQYPRRDTNAMGQGSTSRQSRQSPRRDKNAMGQVTHLLGLDTCNFMVLPENKTLSTWSKWKVSFKGPIQFSSWLATSLSYLLGD